jgi:type VI secretion system protein ImpM
MSGVGLGWYGKLPSRGDFAGSGLSRETVDAWDGWVQAVLPAVLAALDADHPPDAWRSTPCWRFALPAGQCGPHALGGLMLPGRDQLDRRYPLLAALEGGAPDAACLDAAEQICQAALQGDATPQNVSAALARVAPGCGDVPAQPVWWRVNLPPLHLTALPDVAQAIAMLLPA